MKNIFSSILVILLINSMLSCNSAPVWITNDVTVISNFSELESIITSKKDQLLVLNFWATSCPPCIKEMPHFNELRSTYDRSDVQIILVSLDEIKYLENRVKPFVEKHKLQPEVYLLQDQNYSAWTDKIDSSWYGALPATLIMKGDERNFRFGIYESYHDLETDIFRVDPSLSN